MTSGEFEPGEYVQANAACALYGNVRIGGERLGLVDARSGGRAVYRYITLNDANGFRADGSGGFITVFAGKKPICRAKADGKVYDLDVLNGRFEIEI